MLSLWDSVPSECKYKEAEASVCLEIWVRVLSFQLHRFFFWWDAILLRNCQIPKQPIVTFPFFKGPPSFDFLHRSMHPREYIYFSEDPSVTYSDEMVGFGLRLEIRLISNSGFCASWDEVQFVWSFARESHGNDRALSIKRLCVEAFHFQNSWDV